MSIGRVNDSLRELIQIAKRPERNWAYEQFEDAREAYRKELYAEALEHLGRAINGHGGNVGYKLEYRFHYFLGTIHLGSFRNNLVGIVNLPKAEIAFLNAARYARMDEPKEAGRAFLAAGWAAYCQGNFEVAIKDTEQALSLWPELAEAHFQLSKIYMHVDEMERALPSLRHAIELDRGYSVKASSDEDFKRHDPEVRALLAVLCVKTRQRGERMLSATTEVLKLVEEREDCIHRSGLTLRADFQQPKRALHEASNALRSGTYYGFRDSVSLGTQASEELAAALNHFLEEAQRFVTKSRDEKRREYGNIAIPFGEAIGTAFSVWFGLFVFTALIAKVPAIGSSLDGYGGLLLITYAILGLVGGCYVIRTATGHQSDVERHLARLQGIEDQLSGFPKIPRRDSSGDVS
jgi:tetratricopeptide (TPR) repeat protein